MGRWCSPIRTIRCCNSQRASARATDEGVPQALSGYRPRVSFNGSVGAQYLILRPGRRRGEREYLYAAVGQHDAEQYRADGDADALQRLSDREPDASGGKPGGGGARTVACHRAEVLLDAATAYMNLLRDQAVLDLQRRNVEVLAPNNSADARPLQRRRSDAHRRCASRIAARRGTLASARAPRRNT